CFDLLEKLIRMILYSYRHAARDLLKLTPQNSPQWLIQFFCVQIPQCCLQRCFSHRMAANEGHHVRVLFRGGNAALQDSGDNEPTKNGPSRVDILIAVKRILSGHAFPPATETGLVFDLYQDRFLLINPPKTG